MTVETLLGEALKLSRADQRHLYEALDDVLHPSEFPELTEVQRQDLYARIEEIDSGKATLIDGEEALRQIRDGRP